MEKVTIIPILYDSVFQAKKVRPKRTTLLLQSEPDHFHVIEEYAVASIYMTPEQLRDHIRDGLSSACEQKGEHLEYFTVLQEWSVWKVVYTEYHIKYEAYIGGSPITQLLAVAIIALCIAILIVIAIWLVIRYVFEPIWGVIPTVAKPWVGTILLVGAGLALAGLGIYVVKSIIPKMK
jgi:hypothetical protein